MGHVMTRLNIPSEAVVGEVDLTIIGTGILGLSQASVQTQEALAKSRKVFHLTSNHEELKDLCQDVVNHADLYWTAMPASEVYRNIIDSVVQEVLKGPGVANVTYGHPLFFDDINMGLIREMKARGLSYQVLPGISCLDTISTDLEIDYGDGLQVYESQEMVYRDHPLNPRIHALILQVAQFGSNITVNKIPTRKGRFDRLEEHLARFYPREHPAIVLFSDRGDSFTRYRVDLTIGELDANQEKMFKGTTLYLPPLPAD